MQEDLGDAIGLQQRVCKRIATRTLAAYRGTGPLYFPDRREGGRRVSEQEARVCCCLVLSELGVPFAVEVPTRESYSFAGHSGARRSAMIDLQFKVAKDSGFVNVEFKAGNPKQACFTKDVEKLVRESRRGLWFHTLQNIDRTTVGVVVDKLNYGIMDVQARHRGQPDILVSVVVLEQDLLLLGRMTGDAPLLTKPDYSVRKGRFVGGEMHGWTAVAVAGGDADGA